MRLPAVPEYLQDSHELRVPGKMVVTGDIHMAESVIRSSKEIQEAGLFVDSFSVHNGGTDMLVMTLPYGRGKNRIRAEHPQKLVEGVGLWEGYTDEAMFVGSTHRRISPEGLVWIGRAIGAENIKRVHYLDLGRIGLGGLGSKALEESSDLHVITDLVDVFSFINKTNGTEIPVSSAISIEPSGVEAIK